jgi:hypothetical protein
LRTIAAELDFLSVDEQPKQRPLLAVSRRSGDEIHPWSPNGGYRTEAEV